MLFFWIGIEFECPVVLDVSQSVFLLRWNQLQILITKHGHTSWDGLHILQTVSPEGGGQTTELSLQFYNLCDWVKH